MSLRESLRRLSGESLVYGLGQVSGRIVNLLLVPVLTRVLLRQEFGVAELVTGYSASVLLVLVLGMDGALARFFYQQADTRARLVMTSSSFVFRFLTGGTLALVLALAAEPLAVRLMGDAVYAKYLRLGALTLPFTLLVLWCNDVLRVTFQPWKFVTLNVAQTVLVGGTTIALVVGRDLGVAGVLYGKLAGDAIAALLGVVLCRHHIRPRFDARVLRAMLGYGVPLVPVAFAYGVVGSVDRWALQHYASLEEVGLYALAIKFFAVVTMAVSAFHLAFMPFAFARAQDPEAPRLYARVFGLYVAIATAFALVVGLAAPLGIRLLATRDYDAAARPALWLAFAAVAQGAYYVAALGLNLALRNTLLGLPALGAALLAAGANVALVPHLGAEGAAIATFAGHAAAAMLTYVIAQRVHPLPYRGARLAALFAVGVALGEVTVRWAPDGVAGGVWRAAAVAAFALTAWKSDVWKDRGAIRHRPAAS
ncbi:MAG: lipopolysaccharide biosynthesis protein [bacterium]